MPQDQTPMNFKWYKEKKKDVSNRKNAKWKVSAPSTAFQNYFLLCVWYIPSGNSCPTEDVIIREESNMPRQILPQNFTVYFSFPKILLWKIILHPKDQSFWL